ncbi:McrB family protein [Flavobacterium sp. ZB4R12]|uniref:McrB family protein n=1 Tax=Flavobacterium sp. ZB4R12 TaxID=3398732 RepID=UPI003AAABDB4
MNEQVMIYEIKSSASTNAKSLFSDDEQYFYWNNTKFKNLILDDFVFVVNATSKWILFTKLDFLDIETEEKGDDTIFYNEGKTFHVSGKWSKFIRLKIISKIEIPLKWEWKSLGSSETTYLNGKRIDIANSNRILNINQLLPLSSNELYKSVLSESLNNFNNTISSEKKQIINPINSDAPKDMKSILNAIKTKPFVLLAGISGTGKSRLVRTLAYQTCSNPELQMDKNKPGNFELIPVRPNWHDSTELMGYISRINGEKYITTSFLKFIAKAWLNLDTPFFLCLDEMNLAPVEQYFAEYLSIVETRQIKKGKIASDYLISSSNFEDERLYTILLKDLNLENDERFIDGISIPNNLIIIGTVNMDETTHSFSRKVLDRAMTFEMNDIDLNAGLEESKKDWDYPENFISGNEAIGEFTAGNEVVNQFPESKLVIEYLQKINNQLEGTPFKIAYRVRDEFLIYCYYASQDKLDINWLNIALDEMISMKILSRIEGDDFKTGDVLRNLQNLLTDDFRKSNSKLKEMEIRLQKSGYTSYWS